MRNSVSSIGLIFWTILSIVVYQYCMERFAGHVVRVFNYNVVVTKCGPVFHDRIKKIEKQVEKR